MTTTHLTHEGCPPDCEYELCGTVCARCGNNFPGADLTTIDGDEFCVDCRPIVEAEDARLTEAERKVS